jgi:high affinity sulfate transporter 1
MAERLRDPSAGAVARRLVVRYLPIVRWLPAYPREWLRPDIIAGLTSWGVMVPVALAYAGLARVPPEFGLVTAFAAMAAYAVMGSSRHLKVTVSSTMAVMSASVIADLAGRDPSAYLGLTAALALIVGGMLVAGGLARLGFISDFLTKSVVTGFIVGLSITIIVGQLPKLLGVPSVSGSLPQQLDQLIGYLPATHLVSLAVGISAIAIILVLRRFAPRVPGPLVVLVLGILTTRLLDLTSRGIAVVGEIATGLPSPGIPSVPLADLPYLVIGATGIVFLAVGESVGAARAYASRNHDELDTDQELLALGSANLASGLLGGFVTDASLSQTATAESAGARSQLSSLITAGLVLATALFLAPLFADLPSSVLGAIVITGVLGLIDIRELHRYWVWRRTDFVIAIAAMVGVLLTTVLAGMLVAMLLSVVLLLFRASRPYVAALGRMPGYRATYGDLARHPEAEPVSGLVIVRLDAPLYFFNANVARTQILDLVRASSSPPSAVLIDLAASADLDVTTTDMLFDLVRELHERSIDVMLAQVKSSVRDRLQRTGLLAEIGEERIYMSIGSAVTDFGRQREADTVAADRATTGPGGAGQREEAGQGPASPSPGDPA